MSEVYEARALRTKKIIAMEKLIIMLIYSISKHSNSNGLKRQFHSD